MKIKLIVGSFLVLTFLIFPASASAFGFGISPSKVGFIVPAAGSTVQEFVVHNFDGELEISLEDIPLRVEPEKVRVAAGEKAARIQLTFYGVESLGSQKFNGKVRFLARASDSVATGIKVKATVWHLVFSQLVVAGIAAVIVVLGIFATVVLLAARRRRC